jgi:hypothetical protein
MARRAILSSDPIGASLNEAPPVDSRTTALGVPSPRDSCELGHTSQTVAAVVIRSPAALGS